MMTYLTADCEDPEDKHGMLSDSDSVTSSNKTESKGFQLLPHGSVAASAFNLASATLGAGTLALPQAMDETGMGVGVFMLALSCCATIYSIRLLMIVLERTGYITYEEIARNLLGKIWEKVIAVLIVAFCWGVTIAYVVAIGDVLSLFNDSPSWPGLFKGDWGNRFVTVIFWALFMLPLSLLKEINSLRYASMIGMISTGILVTAIVVHSAEENNGHLKGARWGFSMLRALPIYSFSYCCQTNSFEVYAELKRRSVGKMTFTTAVSMITCTCIYIVAGIAGSSDFGDDTKGNILVNYGLPTRTWYIAIAVVAISFTLTMAFPICIFPTRDAIVQLMGYENVYQTPSRVRIAVCVALSTLSLICGLFVPNIDVLFGLLGGIFGSSLGYIFPVIFAWKSGEWTVATVGKADVIGAWVLLVGGVICGIGGTGMTIYGIATGD